MAEFKFDPIVEKGSKNGMSGGNMGLGRDLLLQDAHWFTRIRWVVIASMLALGILPMLMPEMTRSGLFLKR